MALTMDGLAVGNGILTVENERQAIELCESLKRSGRDCFVRHVSGDAPVQFASR